MCDCKNIDPGSYDNQILIVTKRHKSICVDKCIADEIRGLWSLGIDTVESCCGHNKQNGYIMVLLKDAKKMITLGYEYDMRMYTPLEYAIFNLATFKSK